MNTWLGEERCPVAEGELRLLSVLEARQLYRDGQRLAEETGEDPALCSNACLIAGVLLREGTPVYASGAQVLREMSRERMERLADTWGEWNRRVNPSARQGAETVDALRSQLKGMAFERLRWRVMRAFHALPTEERVRAMTERDYLWCALNLALDWEEELDRLCPRCRERAETQTCPVCGEPLDDWGQNHNFDLTRFRERGGAL